MRKKLGLDISEWEEDRLSDFHGIAVVKQGNHVLFDLVLFDEPFHLCLAFMHDNIDGLPLAMQLLSVFFIHSDLALMRSIDTGHQLI